MLFVLTWPTLHFVSVLRPHAHDLLQICLICFSIICKSSKPCSGQKNYHGTDGSKCSCAIPINILHNESPYLRCGFTRSPNNTEITVEKVGFRKNIFLQRFLAGGTAFSRRLPADSAFVSDQGRGNLPLFCAETSIQSHTPGFSDKG